MKTRILFLGIILGALAACTPAPTSDFTVSGTGHYWLKEEVTFRSAAIGASSLQWDFGDGQTAIGAEVTHQYEALGSYTATLTAVSENGKKEDVASRTISIDPRVVISLTLDTIINLPIENVRFTIENDSFPNIEVKRIEFDPSRGVPQTVPLNLTVDPWTDYSLYAYIYEDTAWVRRLSSNLVTRWIDTISRDPGIFIPFGFTYYLKP